MKKSKTVSGLKKLLFYCRMSVGCALHFLPKMRSIGGVLAYFRFLKRAGHLTKVFYKHKLLRLPDGRYKMDFYLPLYPSEAFFDSMVTKFVNAPPRPATVVLSITRACQYHCPHCYQGCDSTKELPLERLLEIVDELRATGVTAYAVEGGDPLLRFDRLLPVLERLKGMEVWINSTGTGSTPEKIHAMKMNQVTGIMSSIHSIHPSEHDNFTKVSGSWERAMNFLADCQQEGFLTGFNTVLTDEQIINGEIDRVMELAYEHNCDYIQLIHPKPCGRWIKNQFQQEQHEKAIEVVMNSQKRYNSDRDCHAPILVSQVFEESPDMLGCTCGGIDRFYIGASGEVQPCEFLNISFGNLSQESYQTIYQRMRSVFPIPDECWVCCEKAEEIRRLVEECNIEVLPVPWELTQTLTSSWKFDHPTKVYQKMGIYKRNE